MTHPAQSAYCHFLRKVGLFMAASGLIIFGTWLIYPPIVRDNHVVENLQVVFLILAAFFSAQNANRLRQLPLDLYVRVFLVFFALAFGLRELDIDTIIKGDIGKTTEDTLRLIVGVPFLAYLVFLLTKTPYLWRERGAVFASPVFHLVVAGCLCYVIGWPFDKKVFASLSFEQCQMAEEILEFWGTALIMLGAWWKQPITKN